MEDDIEQFFLHKKPVDLIVKLNNKSRNCYASALSSDIDATYSHTVKILQRMEEFGLVEFEKQGRKKTIELTQKGREIARLLHKLTNRLD
ncbi:MAG: hypothetical protein ABEJ98_02930 [Candidatus Nanohaloarchaea archaeon]